MSRSFLPDPAAGREKKPGDFSRCRVVVLGGGTGLSTVVGGGSQKPLWAENPFVGLKRSFPRLEVAVVTTDDGGSTGQLLRRFPLIGIGDLRKSCLSLVQADLLARTYGLRAEETLQAVRALQQVFNYRFPVRRAREGFLRNPVALLPPLVRRGCPPELGRELARLGSWVAPGGAGPGIHPGGHCLGNLLLAGAILGESGRWDRPPSSAALRRGLDRVARLIGAFPGRMHPVTAVPGQIRFRYANGVEVLGQRKAALARRGFPVERVIGVYSRAPRVPAALRQALLSADLIVYAPGSLYSSMIPLLQHPEILFSIRSNSRALKILAANFWIQEGETDLAPGRAPRGFLVSDLIKAYERNLPGGVAGLFDLVLSANLEQVTGAVLGNYALEGKYPIHLDREESERLGIRAVEADLFPPGVAGPQGEIHHDPERFRRAVEILLREGKVAPTRGRRVCRILPGDPRLPLAAGGLVPCDYLTRAREILRARDIASGGLRDVLLETAWENRDIALEHLACLSRVGWTDRVERAEADFDFFPAGGEIFLARELSLAPERLAETLLAGIGEAVFGCPWAWERRRGAARRPGPWAYELRLAASAAARSFLSRNQVRRYLELIRMLPSASDPDLYRILINPGEWFCPPGRWFGMVYAWYLNAEAAPAVEYQMSALRRPEGGLLPGQLAERARLRGLIDFFREEIFPAGASGTT